ncbi:MAG: signal peptidase I [Polyangiaceae bacterium]|nr:signal peptidase I [Polyangiaceae bacterium]
MRSGVAPLLFILAACSNAPGVESAASSALVVDVAASATTSPGAEPGSLDAFVRDAPKESRILGRIRVAANSELFGIDAQLRACGAPPGSIEEIRGAFASAEELLVEVVGKVSKAHAECLLGGFGLVFAEPADGVVRARVGATPAGPPKALVEAFRAMDAESIAVVIEEADKRLTVRHTQGAFEIRGRLAAGEAASAKAWWETTTKAVKPLIEPNVEVEGNDIVVRLSASGPDPVAAALRLRESFLEAFKMPSGSMTPTLLREEQFFVDKTDKQARYGDILAYWFPANTRQAFVHRIIGLPGDTVEVVDGQPSINGWPVPRCRVGRYQGEPAEELFVEFLGDRAYTVLIHEGDRSAPFIVPPKEVYVLGDNRYSSHDSRMWNDGAGGGLPLDLFIGKASFVFFDSLARAPQRWLLALHGAPVLTEPSRASLAESLARCLSTRPSVADATPPRRRK